LTQKQETETNLITLKCTGSKKEHFVAYAP